MRVKLAKFSSEITDFLTIETVKAIDYGVLDLELLAVELELNYLENKTGIFRVSKENDFWYYRQERHVIRACSLEELKRKVIVENRIWYVFDENLVKRLG